MPTSLPRYGPTWNPGRCSTTTSVGARPQPAGRVLAIGALALLLAALLNIDGLAELANRQPLGWKRDVARVRSRPSARWAASTRLRDARTAIRDAADKETQPCEDDPASGEGAFRADLTTTTAAAQTTGPPVTVREVSSTAPLRTFLGGDSMAIELANSVETAVADRSEIALTTNARVSTGLTRPDFDRLAGLLRRGAAPDRARGRGRDLRGQRLPGDGHRRLPVPAIDTRVAGGVPAAGRVRDGPAAGRGPTGGVGRSAPHARRRLRRADGRAQRHLRGGGREPALGGFLDSRAVLSPDGDGYQVESGGTTLRQADGIHLSRAGRTCWRRRSWSGWPRRRTCPRPADGGCSGRVPRRVRPLTPRVGPAGRGRGRGGVVPQPGDRAHAGRGAAARPPAGVARTARPRCPPPSRSRSSPTCGAGAGAPTAASRSRSATRWSSRPTWCCGSWRGPPLRRSLGG